MGVFYNVSVENESVPVSGEQLQLLRRICERLAYIAGGSLPPVLSSPDDIIATLSGLTDQCAKKVSRSRQDHEELREIRHELENVERLKARFIKNITHELRQPLASIDGFARALMRLEESIRKGEPQPQNPPEVREQFLTIISQEAQRLGNLVEDVLTVSEMDGTHRRGPTPELFSANQLFSETLASYPEKARPPITLRVKEGAEAPLLYADRKAVVEVLRELLNNASKFSDGEEIVLGAERVSISPDQDSMASESGMQQRVTTATRIFVRDRGIGIPVEELPYIFDKFYRGEAASRNIPGTGLGLAIARALVNQNSGQIWASSTPGQGTTVHVLLPDRAPGSGGAASA